MKAYSHFPKMIIEVLRKYFRVQVYGSENIPRKGAAVIAPNHSGFMGLDAFILPHVIRQDHKRIARVLSHHFWFLTPTTALPAKKLGFTEATLKNGIQSLKKNNLIIIFPEGEYGNFKPSKKKYRLQEFKRGFIRMALSTGAPIIPTLIIGAEETSINLKQIRFPRLFKGFILPLPLNLLPFPVQWKIVFLPPIHLNYKPDAADDPELVRELAEEIQDQMQEQLRKALKRT